MPGFDGTGPEGKGPKTGRRRGNCDDNKSSQSRPDPNKESWLDILIRILRLIKK